MNDDKPKGTSSHDTSQETTDFASHLLVFASHLDIQDYTGHQDYDQPPTLTTDYLARLLNGNPPHILYITSHFASNRTILPFGLPLLHSSTIQYFRWSKSMRSHWQLNASIMEVLYFEFSLYSLFFAIYQNY